MEYNLQKDTKELIYKMEHTDVENKCMVTKGEIWGGVAQINQELGINTLLHITYITNKDLLYSPRNSPQYSVRTHMGKESEKGSIYVPV